MSRLGKRPVVFPDGVLCSVDAGSVLLKGPKGETRVQVPSGIRCSVEGNQLSVNMISRGDNGFAFWGMVRSLLQSAVRGVSEGFQTDIKMEGVGYRAALSGQALKLQLGFSHDVMFPIPEGIEIKVKTPTELSVIGHCRQKVGQVVSDIQAFRPPEPYKGKGVHRVGQFVLRKKGKKK
jgi:large subunit ribosomal protein L6